LLPVCCLLASLVVATEASAPRDSLWVDGRYVDELLLARLHDPKSR
jgi:hypothetical protein